MQPQQQQNIQQNQWSMGEMQTIYVGFVSELIFSLSFFLSLRYLSFWAPGRRLVSVCLMGKMTEDF